MKNFLWGVAVTFGVGVMVAVAAYLYLKLGYFDFRADIEPSRFETALAMGFLDASVERRASDERNPIPPTEPNLREGLRLYVADCAGCHGSPSRPNRELAHLFYPPAPNFVEEPPDMAEIENFYIIKHGIRWTGMPAWKTTLSDQEIWEIVTFLGRLDKLPVAVQQTWKEPSHEAGH